MTKIIRWNPYSEAMSLRNAMDRLIENAPISHDVRWFRPTSWDLALDVAENDDEYIVKASLPGIDPDDLEITIAKNVLTIKGEVEEEKEIDDASYHLRERRSGKFSRSVRLSNYVDNQAIEASYQAGVLTLHLPKVEEAKPKRIEVRSVDASKIIEGEAANIKTKN